MPSFNRITGGLNSIRFNHAALGSLDLDVLKASATAAAVPAERIAAPPEFQYLRFEDVHYRYQGTSAESLIGVSLKVGRGEHVGIVGSTGAGKSTLINLLLGLLDPTKGAVFIGAERLPEVRARWQRMIGYVPQSIYLLDDTVRRNVAIGIEDSGIKDADVWIALEAARVADKFRALPQGLDTAVGENGVRLSGGERQRVGIARALFAKPQVMIFDEATSSLDRQTESEITQTIHALGEQRTVIVVTHRIATTLPCDRIYVVDGGRVVQAGTYAQLFETNSWFRSAAGEPAEARAAQRA
jgi:ATP-binding cassette subfamily C protein